jgi:hypothetical protein
MYRDKKKLMMEDTAIEKFNLKIFYLNIKASKSDLSDKSYFYYLPFKVLIKLMFML